MYFCMLRQKVLVQLMAIIVIDCLLCVLPEVSAQGLSVFAASALFYQLMFSVLLSSSSQCWPLNLGSHAI